MRRRDDARLRGASPSDRARVLVEGAYDLHVHVAPDVPQRRIDDRTLAQRFAELGLAGFALKSHYTSTAERAQVVSALVPEVEVVGTLTLNWAVGGMNAARRRDRRPRGRADRLDADGRLARGDGGEDRAEGRGQGSPVGATPARASRASA